MSRRSKRKKNYRYYRRRRLKKRSLRNYLGSRLVEISIILVTAALALYAFSFFTRLNRPTAKRQGQLVLARTQILNASHQEGVVRRVAERLRESKANNISYQIVESADLEDFTPPQTMILDRLGDQGKKAPSRVAVLTAQTLGIDSRNVVFKALEDNYEGISLTIVIGSDGDTLFPET
jgi:hypothetical protein